MLHQSADAFRPSTDLPPSAEDAALLALGVKLDAAAKVVSTFDDLIEVEDTDENWERLSVACAVERDIVREIEAFPATTLAGLRIKARAVSRCHCDEPIDDRFFCLTDDAPTTDLRLAAGILRDLLSLPALTSTVAL